MAMRNDGGRFSNSKILQLLGEKVGSMSEDELAMQERIPEEAAQMAMGTIGKISGPKVMGQGINKVGEGIKLMPTAEQAVADQVAAKYANAPKNFFELAKQKATELGVGPTQQEIQNMAAQKEATKMALARRNEAQIAARKSPDFGAIKKALGNK